MTKKTIATDIVNQKLFKASLVKLAYGGASAMTSAPAAPGGKAPAANLKTNPGLRSASPALPTNPLDKLGPSVGASFLSGAGQGIKNQFGAMGDFGRGAVTSVVSPIVGLAARPFNKDYSNDMFKHTGAGLQDVANSFGRFVGVHDAWDKNTGQYRGAQPANALADVHNYMEDKYYGGDASKTWEGALWRGATDVGNAAAESLPIAAAAPLAFARAARFPGISTVGKYTPKIVKDLVTYVGGVPVKQNVNAPVFAASNFGQQFLDTAGIPMPAVALDTATRNTFGAMAPEIIDAARFPGVGGLGAAIQSATIGAQPAVEKFRADGDEAYLQNQMEQYQNTYADQATLESRLGALSPEQQTRVDALDAKLQAGEGTQADLFELNRLLAPQTEIPASVKAWYAAPSGPGGSAGPAMAITPPAPPSSVALKTEPPRIIPEQTAREQPFTNSESGQAQPVPATPQAAADVVPQYLPEGTPPEQQQAAVEAVSAVATPENQQKMQTPEGQAEIKVQGEQAHADQAQADFAAQNPPPENPQDFGAWAQSLSEYVSQSWTNLGEYGQLAVGLGMPLGIIGLMAGGLPGILAAVFGFGAAGLAGAATGAFGENAQNQIFGLADAALPTPETTPEAQNTETPQLGANEQPVNNSTPATAETAAASPPQQNVDWGNFAQQFAKTDNLQEFLEKNKTTLQQLNQLPDADISKILSGLSQTDRGAFQRQLTNLNGLHTVAVIAARTGQDLAPPEDVAAIGAALKRLKPLTKKSSFYIAVKTPNQIVAKQLALAQLNKAARCWAGYEPVPGKKPYSEDSCRPIGGKKKKKKKKQTT